MHSPIVLPDDASEEAILSAIDRWVALLEAEQYELAYYSTEQDTSRKWTPDLMRQVISQYGDAVLGQKVTMQGKPTDIIQRKNVLRFEKNHHGFVGHVSYDLNINGFASDLTATFDLRAVAGGIVLVLDDIHVM